MRLVTPSEMRLIERQAEADYGLSPIVLMENAGARLADLAMEIIGDSGGSVVVVAGLGNNGGDGFVAARHLVGRGVPVNVHLLGRESELRGDALTNFQVLSKMTSPDLAIAYLHEPQGLKALAKSLATAQLAIDALFGTGLRGPVTGLAAAVVRSLNASGTPALAVDIPSGVDGTTGQVLVEPGLGEDDGDGAVRARFTLTLGLPKAGLFLYPGAEYAGEVVVADIGLPANLKDDAALYMSLITRDEVAGLLPVRRPDSHKGDYGHALMVGGSPGLTGAIAMASEAALRAGAGLVTAAVPASLSQVLALKLTEVMTLPLPEDDGLVSREAYEVLVRRAQRAAALAVGPGLGTGAEVSECLKLLLGRVSCPLIVDADGLRVLAAHADVFRMIFQTSSVPPVLTPHPGEMAGLTGLSVDAVQKYRADTAREVAQQWKSVVVLKGAHTIVAAPSGRMFINLTGNAGMATAGSGDVLTGLIAGLLAQGLAPLDAAVAGVHLHGLAGDLAAKETGLDSLTAGDLLKHIPAAIMSVRGSEPVRGSSLVRPR